MHWVKEKNNTILANNSIWVSVFYMLGIYLSCDLYKRNHRYSGLHGIYIRKHLLLDCVFKERVMTSRLKKAVILIIVIAMFASLCACFDGSGSTRYSSSASKTFRSCNSSFSDETNKNYIINTNMCKNCYQNYCWASGMKPSNYDR